MSHEFVVVGGGIGGLTAAALLAARGVDVCLLERESQVGGCVAGFQKFGYAFDSGIGLYPLWQPGAIHDRIFSMLPVKPPQTRLHDPAYVVRLPDHSEVPISANAEKFEATLRANFPECSGSAISFYQECTRVSDALTVAFQRLPELHTAGKIKQISSFLPHVNEFARISGLKEHTVLQHLHGTSPRFRRFVDVQLQVLAQSHSEECPYLYAAVALTLPRQHTFSIQGGSPAVAAALADSIKRSGGSIRLNATVLRMAYDSHGNAIGVDLMTGETVEASRGIISNLTVWDTYGRLIGLSRTPSEVRKRLSALRGWGAYLIYLGLDEQAATRISHHNILALTDWGDQAYNPENSVFMFATSPSWDTRAPAGKRAATAFAFTDVDQWFTFHENDAQHDELDQLHLESCWRRIHQAIPELGDGVEVIETATPSTYYESTRRKLGMIGVGQTLSTFGANSFGSTTSLPNVFMVGDTTFPGVGLATVSFSALTLIEKIFK